MPTVSTFLVVAGASYLLAVIPGPAVMFIVTRSVERGRAAGLTSASGVAVGGVIHVLFAALGLSVVLARSATAFTVVKGLGAGYLIVMGLRKLLGRSSVAAPVTPATGTDETPPTTPGPLSRVFANGFVVNVLNPKVAIFFLAFLPQFVDSHRGRPGPQLVALGLTYVLVALTSDSIYAVAASAIARRLRRRRDDRAAIGTTTPRALERIAGVIYIALGVIAALARRPVTKSALARV
jgi:threonine/homoserine/homoserine lactone efflux protein